MKKYTGEQNRQTPAMTPLAIVGIGSLFPQAGETGIFWSNIKQGVDAITEVPASHWRSDDYFDPDPKTPDKVYARYGGFLSPVDFRPMEYGVLPNALEAIDTSQLLGLVAVDQALQDAGYSAERRFDRDRVSVILGVTGTLELVVPLGARLGHPRWREALKDAGVADAIAEDVMVRISESYVPWQENSFPGLLGNVVAGRISKHFDFGGTNCVVDAACGSSLSALNLAALELETGRADMVVTGGIDTFNDIFMYTCFSKTPALSPSGHARPFDADGDGTTLGEGLGIVIVKRLADAERDGDRIYAIIKGLGTSSDGRGAAIYEPSATGQQKALRRAYQQADVDPRTIELIEAHGTGTRVGDAVEVTALKEVFGTAEQPWCAIGSIKSQIGHTKAAAGSAGLIKAALSLYNKVLPPTIKVNKPLEAVTAADSPFYVNSEARPWLPREGSPRRAGISALGFGGSNFHCLLEEHQARKLETDWSGHVQIIAFSADHEQQLEKALQEFPGDGPWDTLRLAADRSRRDFDPRQLCRLLLVVDQRHSRPAKQIQSALSLLRTKAGETGWSTPDGIFFGRGESTDDLAVLFPGQGAQYPGMLRELATQFPQFLETLAAADRVFSASAPASRERLSERIYPRPVFDQDARQRNEAELRATQIAQPALGAVSLGAMAVLSDFGLSPRAFAGHSYGELTALCAAGCFDEQDLYLLSRLRGELMASGVGDRGSMLAVSAPLEQIESLLEESGLTLVLANRNTPEQGVISGASAEIKKAARLFEEKGLRCTPLAVAAAFHSELVADAGKPFAERLLNVEFKTPVARVYANTTGQPYPDSVAATRQLLAGQLASPVDFVSEIEAMYAAGLRTFVEVGPGARLTAMVKAILGDRPHQACAIDSSQGKRSGIEDLARCLAQLAASGQSIVLPVWDESYAASRSLRPAKKSGMTVALTGANYFKPPRKRAPLPQPVAVPHHPVAAAVTAVEPRTDAGAVSPPAPGSAPPLQEALQVTRQSLAALQTLQEQTASLHQQFLSGQESATRTVLQLVEQQNRLLQGASLSAGPRQTVGPPAAGPGPESIAVAGPESLAGPLAPGSDPCPAATVDTAQPQGDFSKVSSTLLAVVAAKTGYPQDMLELDMTLDTDLGIDSIKRVEILSALQEHLPDAPPIRPEDLGALQTLGQIINHLGAAPPDKRVLAQTADNRPALEDHAVAATLLAVIAEKTGYPQDMLELDMTLDTDLGIDSIKRVEILSTLQERLPDAPLIRPEDLGALQTLGQIIDHLSRAAAAPLPSSPPPASAGLDRKQVAAVLLRVIADKTGYPQEMLELEMTLDTDLGIDSIKRVEILSALQDQLPGAPPIKPEHLGTLQTVSQIVDFLASVSGAAEPLRQTEPVPDPASAGKGLQCRELRVVPVPDDADRLPLTLPQGARVWVTEEGTSLNDALCAQLIARGLVAEKISLDRLDQLAPGEDLAGLILLTPASGVDAQFLHQAFRLVQKVEAALSASARRGGAALATVSRINGCFGLPTGGTIQDPLSGGLAGLAKTAAHEWPAVNCRAFDLAADLEDDQQTAQTLLAELLVDGARETGITRAGLYTLELVESSAIDPSGPPPVGYGDVVVISGGARGVTAEAAVALAEASHATLLLLGRSPVPRSEPDWLAGLSGEAQIKKALVTHAEQPLKPRDVGEQCQAILAGREIRTTLQRIKQAGGQAVYRSVDLRDQTAVVRVLADVREEYGPIRGLIHGAGVLADRLLKDKTPDQFDQVYATKVDGLHGLLDALGEDDLRFLVMFSSSTARFGRKGQVDYAMANEILNKMAWQLAVLRPTCRVLSLNWGPWDGGMVTPALRQVFAAEGIAVIDLEAGADFLVRQLAAPAGGPVELVILGGCDQAGSQDPGVPHENIYVSKAFDLELSVDHYPFLSSHVIDGRAVLPLALMIEWMAHAAIHNNPGLRFHGFNDLRVLKGVTLDRNQLHPLQVMTGKAFKSGGMHVVPVELSGTVAGQPFIHCRGRILLTAKLPEGKPAMPRGQLAPYSQSLDEIYRSGRLFHGPEFQAIREVLGCTAEGIACLVRPAPLPTEWIRQPMRTSWLADPLALDSSFQLMILWSFECYKAGSLPVFAGRYRQYRERFPAAGTEIRISVTSQSRSKATADIDFVEPGTGALVARIEDYECVIDASLNTGFQRNKLQGVA